MGDTRSTYSYRIGEGGLLRRFEVVAHLTTLRGQLFALLAVTWLPMVALGLFSERPDALVYDSAVHVRLLVVAPLLLLLDHLFPRLCRYTLGQLQEQNFVPSAAEPRLRRLLHSAVRASDSFIPEAVLALLAFTVGVATLSGVVSLRGMAPTGLAPDQIWYALTDLPLFHFLLARSVWRWAIWVRILAGLATLDLALVPSHPDRCGGIRILNLPSFTYCAILLFALSSVLCAEWEVRASVGATLASFAPLLMVLAAGGIMLALGPLCLFVPQLLRAKRRGLDELGGVATAYGRELHAALVSGGYALDSRFVQAIAGAEQSYRETVKALSVLPFDKKDLIAMLVVTLLPVVPALLVHVPHEDWWALTSLITGLKP